MHKGFSVFVLAKCPFGYEEALEPRKNMEHVVRNALCNRIE